jgi:hypothetical protein
MEGIRYRGQEHRDAIEMVQMARDELVRVEREVDRLQTRVFAEMTRVQFSKPPKPTYDHFSVEVSTKGMNPGVYADSQARYAKELKRRQDSQRARDWAEIKRSHQEQCEAIQRQLAKLQDEANKIGWRRDGPREDLKLCLEHLFTFNPPATELPDFQIGDIPEGVLWRGTLLHRVSATMTDDNRAIVEAMGDSLYGDAYDFTPHAEVAMNYANGVNINDFTRDRSDAVVVGFRLTPDIEPWKIQPAHEGEEGNVIVPRDVLEGREVYLYRTQAAESVAVA